MDPILLLLGAGVTWLVFEATRTSMKQLDLSVPFDFSSTGQMDFNARLPSGLRPWASLFVKAGQTYNVNPWLLAGICWNESRGGSALKPVGAGGTGDFITRSSGHVTWKFANPATGLPPDGLGWGRGLMQIDYGVHNDWVTKNNWADPVVNINKAAEIFRMHMDYFRSQPGSPVFIDCWRLTRGIPQYRIEPWRPKYGERLPICSSGAARVGPYPDPRPLSGQVLYEAALASYNAGFGGVLQAVALKIVPEAPTTGQDYVSKILRNVEVWKHGIR
jgi:hypothetical protein